MKPVYIFRHLACEGPGYMARVLERRGIAYEIIAIDRDDAIPVSPAGAAALVFMGGPMSANDDLPWIGAELELIRRAAAQGVPMLGHCLGAQLISRALGALVTRNPVKEIGWLPVEQVPGPHAGPWLEGLPARFEVFHWHGETFALPEGATHLLRSEHCENQAWALDGILALQCHVEMTPTMVGEWSGLYADEIAAPSDTVQSREAMHENLHERVRRLNAMADVLYEHWLARLART